MQQPDFTTSREAGLPAVGPSQEVNGYGAPRGSQHGAIGARDELPTSLAGLGFGPERLNGAGSTSLPWETQRPLQATHNGALGGHGVSEGSGAGSAWQGSLWGDTGNIWSPGPSLGTARSRRSVDNPPRVDDGMISRLHIPTDSRRSLDSLGALQAIWEARQNNQQHSADLSQIPTRFGQPGPIHEHQANLLPQQLEGLSLHSDRFHPQPALHLGAQNGFRQGQEAFQLHGGLGPELQASLPGGHPASQPQFGDSFRSSPGLVQNGSFPNSFGSGGAAGLSSGLSPAHLQAALQDPATARLLQQQLDASALLSPSLHLRNQPNGHTGLQSAAIRQPPPPPPRPGRPQLPPPMQMHPSPPAPRTNGASHLKKMTGFTPQRVSAKDRSSLLGAKPKADMEVLNQALEELVESLRPSAEELEKQDKAFLKVSRLLNARWPHARVHQFGSTANSLSICNNNDIDVCLEIVEPEGDTSFRSHLIEEMGDLLMDAGMANVLPLPKARVPVVKFAVPETGTKVDVSVNNTLAIVNTKLLRDYAAVDARLPKLAFVVKHWAKRRQVNDSYRGTLSSYCYVLMCVHHLQTRQPPVLPCLQAIQPPTHIRTIGRWSCDYYDKPMPTFGERNRETLAELAWSFFENWAWRHDYNNAVVSVRTGALLTKAQKDWTRRIGNERHLICIEDPFETSHDLGRTVDRQTSGILHKEFERAASILRDQAEPLAQLFEPYRAGKPE